MVPENQKVAGGKASASETDLGDAKSKLDQSSFKLLLEELEYDEKCLSVYQQKVNNYEVRLTHQRDAKAAVNQWQDMKVLGKATC